MATDALVIGQTVRPATDEVKRRVDFVETVTGCVVVLVDKSKERALVFPVREDASKAVEAASLAAEIVFNSDCPDADWVNGGYQEASRRLSEICGVKGWSPFATEKCPLPPHEVEQGLTYLRHVFMLDEKHPNREVAARFLAWAKENAS